MNSQQPVYALITGAGQGLGRAFAKELAGRGINVLLTALPGENLQQFCYSLQLEHKINADYFECDLTQEEDIYKLIHWIKANYSINMLINNAGMGGTSEFEKADARFISNMILLNVRATALLTHQLLPLLRRHKQAWILNVASMASFSPIGYKTVYPATKVFVLNFSRGLYEELKGSGIFVSVVHPGPMQTNADTTYRIKKQGWRGQVGLISPEVMARRSVDQLLRKDSLILVGWMNKINWLLMKTIPIWIRLPLITRIVKKETQTSKKEINRYENLSYRHRQLFESRCDN